MLTEAQAAAFVEERHRGVLATIKQSDGRPQLSNVMYAAAGGTARISVTADRAKTANLRADDRASLYVVSDDFWTYVVAEGRADLSPVADTPSSATATALLELYEAVQGGSHPDPDEFRQAMVDDRRLLLTVYVQRYYPTA